MPSIVENRASVAFFCVLKGLYGPLGANKVATVFLKKFETQTQLNGGKKLKKTNNQNHSITLIFLQIAEYFTPFLGGKRKLNFQYREKIRNE